MCDTQPRQRDAGMTLPELLITISMIGLVATVITASIIVTLRTNASTEGRLNVASAERSVAVWLPRDLASANPDSADTTPGASPCGAPVCDGEPLDGSNALMVSWPDGSGTVTVAYMYGLSDDGVSYELTRVHCKDGACDRVVVLRGLSGPNPATFTPGVTPVPADVINVAVPLLADATTEAQTDAQSSARRIVVTIDGGGGTAGAGGGVNQISITAGGTTLGTLAPTKVTGPSFLDAKSRCGGPITVIVDDSGSIAGAGAGSTVESAVKSFIDALAGTPTKVQIVKFARKSALIEADPDGNGTNDWNWYYDMTDLDEVDRLTESGGVIEAGLVQSGGTNWEDAIYRTFYANRTDLGSDGRPINLANDGNPATELPRLVVFFTDGEPTYNRAYGSSVSAAQISSGGPLFPTGSAAKSNKWPLANGSIFDQEGWDRSLYLLNPFLNENNGTRVIGVGVGGIATNQVYSFTQPMLDAAVGKNGANNGIVYSTSSPAGAYSRWNAPTGTLPNNSGTRNQRLAPNVPAKQALGNLIAGVHPTTGPQYIEATYTGGPSGTWTNFDSQTHLLSTNDWTALGKALTTIALGECGGTVTLQTKKGDGSLASSDVTYQVDLGTAVELATTSQITRAAAVDLKFASGDTQATTTIVPADLGVSGYTATGWTCTWKGAALPSAQWSLITPGDPSKGINLTVNANQAVACTMTVAG